MARSRAPWWMYLFGASFLGCFSLVICNDFLGPEPPGISVQFAGGAMVLTNVRQGGAADQAGLKAGDRVISVDGQRVRNIVDWMGLQTNFEARAPYRLEIERGHQRLELTLALWQRQPFKEWEPSSQQRSLAFRGSQLFLLLIALVIAFNKPHDLVARIGAWFLASLSTFNATPPVGLVALWRHLPSPIGALMWLAAFSSFLGSPLLFAFFSLFPRKLFSSRWMWIGTWVPMIFVIPPCVAFWYHAMYRPEHVTGIVAPWSLLAVVAVASAYIIGGFAALIVNYHRIEDVNQRRRVRMLVIGSMIGILPVTLRATMGFLPPFQRAVGLSTFLDYSTVALTPVFPLSFAYATLRHQLFDIRLIIRNGLQYAVARGVLLYIVPATAAALVFHVVLHKDETLASLLSQRGWLYVLVIGLAFLAHSKRQSWLEALDRRFFREHYDARRLLREVAEEARAAQSLDQMALRLVARLEAALHPEFVALLVREQNQPTYRTVATAPTGHVLPELPAESKLIKLVQVLGRPLEVPHGESDWLEQELPEEETQFLHSSGIELLVPVTTSPTSTEVLLALGSKRSEEPYSGEDKDLIAAITASLTILVEKPAIPVAPRRDLFEECPDCGTCYDTGIAACARDGATLVPTILPRLLGGRYHLKRRLGRGGMGAVYEATDNALGRHVAVKVIRDDLVASAQAAERFRREARAAASFAHPNAVTVYDFGVEGMRAYLVMELLEGNTVREELRRVKRFTAARALEILQDVCAALEAAHRRNLVHRDLKPENILVLRGEATETAKVLDFGLAKFLPDAAPVDEETLDPFEAATGAGPASGLTTPGLLVGTLHYMSPEQLRGGSVQPSWDIWALSIIAYEMLTGGYPFALKDISEFQRLVLSGNFVSVSARVADAPQAWQSFFDSALNCDLGRRPESIRAWFDHLDRCLAFDRPHVA